MLELRLFCVATNDHGEYNDYPY